MKKTTTILTATFFLTLLFLVRPATAQFTNFETKSVVSSIAIENIGERMNAVWVGTFGDGLMQYDLSKRPYATYTYDERSGLMSNRIRAVYVSQTGLKYIGTDRGFQVYDGRTYKAYRTADGLSNSEINSFSEDSEGNIWIATKDGVSMLSGTTLKKYTEKQGFPVGNVRTIRAAPDGLWMATERGVAYRSFATEKLRYFTSRDGLGSDNVYAVELAPDGGLWAATTDGLSIFEGTRWRQYTTGYKARCLFIDNTGAIWLGTETQGVIKIAQEGTQVFRADNGLFSNNIYALAGDDLGTKWIGTDRGATRYDDVNRDDKKLDESFYQKIFLQKASANLALSEAQYSRFILSSRTGRSPEVLQASLELAQLTAIRGDHARAAIIAKANADAAGAGKIFGQSLFAAAQWFEIAGAKSEALAAYVRCLDSGLDEEVEAEAAVRAGALAELSGDYPLAERCYKKIYEKYPGSGFYDEAVAGLGSVYKKSGEAERGEDLQVGVMQAAKNFEALYKLGNLYERLRSQKYFAGIKREPVGIRTISVPSRATSIAVKGSDIYIGTESGGLFLSKGGGNAVAVPQLETIRINEVLLGFDKRLYIATNSPAEMEKKRKGKKVPLTEFGLGTRFGVFSFADNDWRIFKSKDVPELSTRIISLAMTPKGKLWAASPDGLLLGKFEGFGNTTWSFFQNIPSRNVRCVAADANEFAWFFTPDRGLYRFDGSTSALVMPDRPMFNDVRQMKADASGKKWLCTDRGLVILDDAQTPARWQAFTTDDGLISNDVTSIAFSPRGGKIAVGTKKGVSFYNGEYWMNFTVRDGLASDDIAAVALSETDELWMATPLGVYSVRDNALDYAKIAESLLAQENTYLISRNADELAKLYTKLSQSERLKAWTEYQLMRLKLRENKISEALAIAKKLESSREFYDDFARYTLARELEKKKAYKEAVEIYKGLAMQIGASEKLKAEKLAERLAACVDALFEKNELEAMMTASLVLSNEKFRSDRPGNSGTSAVSRALYKTAFLFYTRNRRPDAAAAKELLNAIQNFQIGARDGAYTVELDFLAAAIAKAAGDYRTAEQSYKHVTELQTTASVRRLAFQLMKQTPSMGN
ncbi:MAG: hypothetical protein IAF08_06420 [Rhizobacter sp.]|nr:hypothetical protein [Chlorobiales bacterium]